MLATLGHLSTALRMGGPLAAAATPARQNRALGAFERYCLSQRRKLLQQQQQQPNRAQVLVPVSSISTRQTGGGGGASSLDQSQQPQSDGDFLVTICSIVGF